MYKTIRMTSEEAFTKCRHVAMSYHGIQSWSIEDLKQEVKKIYEENKSAEQLAVALFITYKDLSKFITTPECNDCFDPVTQAVMLKFKYLGVLDFSDYGSDLIKDHSFICHLYLDEKHPHSTLRWCSSEDTEDDIESIVEQLRSGNMDGINAAVDRVVERQLQGA